MVQHDDQLSLVVPLYRGPVHSNDHCGYAVLSNDHLSDTITTNVDTTSSINSSLVPVRTAAAVDCFLSLVDLDRRLSTAMASHEEC